jgi:hypothetical protein
MRPEIAAFSMSSYERPSNGERDAEAELIGASVDRLEQILLGRHVGRSAHHRVDAGERRRERIARARLVGVVRRR